MNFKEIKRLLDICSFEDDLYANGFINIAGSDEVGRGSLAGPLVAAAVILDRKKIFIEKVNDSKKITEKNRISIFRNIIKNCKCWSVAKISPGAIDKITLQKANILVIKKAILNLKISPDIVLTDSIDVKMKMTVFPVLHSDELSISIAAASIIAKVIRDKMMIKLSRSYPEYDFISNKGYGTKKHLKVLQKIWPLENPPNVF